jgi:hypothetical protein
MTRSYIADDISTRSKSFFKQNRNQKSFIFVNSSNTTSSSNSDYGTDSNSGSTQTTLDKITELVYYIEYDREIDRSKSSNFYTKHNAKLVELKLDTDFLSAFGTKYINSVITDESKYSRISLKISSKITATDSFYKISQLYLEELKRLISLRKFNFTFADENNNSVITNIILKLTSSSYENYYKYNVLYRFDNNTNLEFKLVNAHTTINTFIVKSGDKVYIQRSNNDYLCGKILNGKFTSDEFFWAPFTSRGFQATNDDRRILFEIHGFNSKHMKQTEYILSEYDIPLEFGFKLEILPSTIKDLFSGLSSFVDGYNFEDDADYVIDNYAPSIIQEWNNRGASYFYNIETGVEEDSDFYKSKGEFIEQLDSDGNTQTYKLETGNYTHETDTATTYDIDEVFLTYENKYTFNFNNDYSYSKVFFNASEI